MFNQVLSKCSCNYKKYNQDGFCCHGNSQDCNCEKCLSSGFRDEQPDTYDCLKKINCYVLKYGYSYISEIYHYLEVSQILEPYKEKNIRVLSLGCGFCPDYYAISKYIEDKKLNIELNYTGYDKSTAWKETRIEHKNVECSEIDLTDSNLRLSFQEFNLIFMNKVFSTIHKCDLILNTKLREIFLENLKIAINTMDKNSVLIFNDVNSIYTGRDIFDKTIKPFFNISKIRRFYTDNPKYKGDGTWIHIEDNGIIYDITEQHGIDILREIRQYVFFEYRK